MKCSVAVIVYLIQISMGIPINSIHSDNDPVERILLHDSSEDQHYLNVYPEFSGTQLTEFDPEKDIIFRLYTKKNPTNPKIINLNEIGTILESNFNPNYPTRIIIHGLNGNGDSIINSLLAESYFSIGEFNIITVDWGPGALIRDHILIIQNVRLIGPYVAKLIDWLYDIGYLDFNHLTLIGHSLGAQICGITGKHISRGKANTIFALDPTLPVFSVDRPNDRVTPTDAEYVEVIHTNGGVGGFDVPIGTADFYPNGGRHQPGCGVNLSGSCAHGRALFLFVESIYRTDTVFTSILCANYTEVLNNRCTVGGPSVNMGGEPSNHNNAKGVYFLRTNSASPFSIE